MLSLYPGLPSLPRGPVPIGVPALPPPKNHRPAISSPRGPLTKCCASSSAPCPEPPLPAGSPSVGLRRLLRVLEDAAMAEVIDMAAKKHQLRVRVLGHCAVWRGRVVCRRGHQCCLSAGEALAPALGHGAESAVTHTICRLYHSHPCRKINSFPTLPRERGPPLRPAEGLVLPPSLSWGLRPLCRPPVHRLGHWGETSAGTSLPTPANSPQWFSESSTVATAERCPNHSASEEEQFFLSSTNIRP